MIRNEQIRLLANALDRVSTACFTIGIVTPTAGYVHNIGGFRTTVPLAWLTLGMAGWLFGRARTTFRGETRSPRTAMIPDPLGFIFAFVATPLIVAGLGYAAVLLHERADRRRHPGE